MMVSNCPRCQIVRGVKLSSLHGRCQIVLFCMMVSNCPRCQIVRGVKLSHHPPQGWQDEQFVEPCDASTFSPVTKVLQHNQVKSKPISNVKRSLLGLIVVDRISSHILYLYPTKNTDHVVSDRATEGSILHS